MKNKIVRIGQVNEPCDKCDEQDGMSWLIRETLISDITDIRLKLEHVLCPEHCSDAFEATGEKTLIGQMKRDGFYDKK